MIPPEGWHYHEAMPSLEIRCPMCASLDNVKHALRLYTLRPYCTTEDGDVVVRAGICGRRQVFVMQTTEGFIAEDPTLPGTTFFADEDDEDDVRLPN